MESGTLIIQQYRTDEDSVCYSEEVAKEIRAPDAGDYISLVIDALCVPWESTGLYYRYKYYIIAGSLRPGADFQCHFLPWQGLSPTE